MGLGEFLEEFAFEAGVDAVPEGEAVGFTLGDLGDVGGVDFAGWVVGELGLDVFWEGGVEGAETVDGAGDAVEGDAFEADFTLEFGGGEGGEVVVGCGWGEGACCLVEGCEGCGAVHCHCCGGGEG